MNTLGVISVYLYSAAVFDWFETGGGRYIPTDGKYGCGNMCRVLTDSGPKPIGIYTHPDRM